MKIHNQPEINIIYFFYVIKVSFDSIQNTKRHLV